LAKVRKPKEDKKKRFRMSAERKKQLIALFLVFLMLGSALVLLVSY